MNLTRAAQPERELPLVRGADDDTRQEVFGVTEFFDPDFFAPGGLNCLRRSLVDGSLPAAGCSGQRIAAPVARPTVVLRRGMRYAAHAESGSPPTVSSSVSSSNKVIRPDYPMLIPLDPCKTGWEVEPSVVVYRRALPGEPERRLEVPYRIHGRQRRIRVGLAAGDQRRSVVQGQEMGVGPPHGLGFAMPDELDAHMDVRPQSWVYSGPRQDSRATDMVSDGAALICELGQFTIFAPGDVVNGGTPQGAASTGRSPTLKSMTW